MLKHSGDGYRADIDGLRAISVMAVVAYHVGLPGAPGGFVGVDIFFVISGFLITQLLLSELSGSGTINLWNFYARRARRLLPAFFLVVGATLLLGFIMLEPLDGEQPNLARSVQYAAFYVSNVYFAQQWTDYFATVPETSPILHTWSLAVEEQFYLVWPAILIVLVVAARRFRQSVDRLIVVTLVAIAVGSFLFCWRASLSSGTVQAGFYFAHSRAWQLALGALLAVSMSKIANRSRLTSLVLTSAGIAAILAAASLYSAGMPYPGTAALLPSLGAVAVIAGGGVNGASASTRLLSAGPLVGLGKLSYSWYLWHWPLLAISRARALGEEDLFRDILIVVGALGLALLTYRYVEDPIRKRRVWGALSTRRVLGAAASVTACLFIAANGMIQWTQAATSDTRSNYFHLASAKLDFSPRRWKCNQNERRASDPWSECTFSVAGAASEVLLWGDSHAEHLTPLMEAVGGQMAFSVTARTMNGCDAINLSTKSSDCLQFNAAVEEELKRRVQQGMAGVVLAGRWVGYADREPLSIERRRRWRAGRARAKTNSGTRRLASFELGLRSRVSAFVSIGLRVIVVAPTPEQRFDPSRCLPRRSPENCSIERADAEAYRAPALKAIERAVDGLPNVRLIDLFPSLCDDKFCRVQESGIIIFRDPDHLTATGARSLLPLLAPQIAWVGATRVGVEESSQ